MSAPAHNPAPNSDGVIHLRPEIIIEPDYRYVQPNAARQSAATLSREQQVLAAYNLGKQHGPEGDNAMAGDAHGKKDDGKGGYEWFSKPFQWFLALAVLLVVGSIFFGQLDKLVNPNAARDTERQALLDRITALENGNARGGGVRVGGGGATVGGGASGGTGRPPTPAEVYQRQLQNNNVTRTRVPCAEGFDLLPNGNCGRWVPN